MVVCLLPRYSACHQKEVVILGAGMAGLGAALKLMEEGCTNFVLLEGKYSLLEQLKF